MPLRTCPPPGQIRVYTVLDCPFIKLGLWVHGVTSFAITASITVNVLSNGIDSCAYAVKLVLYLIWRVLVAIVIHIVVIPVCIVEPILISDTFPT